MSQQQRMYMKWCATLMAVASIPSCPKPEMHFTLRAEDREMVASVGGPCQLRIPVDESAVTPSITATTVVDLADDWELFCNQYSHRYFGVCLKGLPGADAERLPEHVMCKVDGTVFAVRIEVVEE